MLVSFTVTTSPVTQLPAPTMRNAGIPMRSKSTGGILHWKLRNDPRVVVMEDTNARYIESLPDNAPPRRSAASAQRGAGLVQDAVHEAVRPAGVLCDLANALPTRVPLGVLGSERCPLRPTDA